MIRKVEKRKEREGGIDRVRKPHNVLMDTIRRRDEQQQKKNNNNKIRE